MFKDIKDIIDSSKKIAITYHISPDGDALGSALALLQGIRIYGKEAYVISKDIIGDNLGFLPYSLEITGEITKPVEKTDCVIVVDCGNYERISADLESFKGNIINIDHHLSNDRYGNINFINVKAAATAEIIYEFLLSLNVEINNDIATCIYTALMTDTGSYRYSNTTKVTHYIAGDLIENGLNHEEIHKKVFDNKSYEKLKLIGLVLNKMELVCNSKIALMQVTEEMIEESKVNIKDSSDIISMGNQIKGIEGSVLLKESDIGIKVSLRSKNDLDVRKIAESLGGGGHTKASGALIKDKTIKEAKEIIVRLLEKELI